MPVDIRRVIRWLIVFTASFGSTASSQDLQRQYGERIDTSFLKKNLAVLTSDSLEGRETGRPGQQKAANYIAGEFFQYGLTPVLPDTFQFHPINTKAAGDALVIVNDQRFVYRRDFFTQTNSLDTVLSFDTLYWCGDWRSFQWKENLKDKALLVRMEADPGSYHQEKFLKQWQEISGRSPAALILEVEDLFAWVDTLVKHQETTKASFPVYWITPKITHTLDTTDVLLKNNHPDHPAEIIITTKWPRFSDWRSLVGQNIPFLVRGSELPGEIVVVTAHYDHLGVEDSVIHYGADDDGSGTVAVMEIARVMAAAAQQGHPPRRSVLFMPVSGEEKGLLGSKYYVAHPVFPLKNTVADVNIDMIGRIDPLHDSLGNRNYIYVIGSDKLSSDLHDINEAANKEFVHLDLDYRYNVPGEPNRFYFRSDHYNFAKNKIPAIFYFNGKHPDYHKPTDTIDKIDFEALKNRTTLAFHTVWELANRKKRIRVNRKNTLEK